MKPKKWKELDWGFCFLNGIHTVSPRSQQRGLSPHLLKLGFMKKETYLSCHKWSKKEVS